MFDDQPMDTDHQSVWTYHSYLLKEADQGLEAGPQVEARLLRALKKRRGARRLRRASTWTALVAAALVTIFAVSRQGSEPAQVAMRSPLEAPAMKAPAETPAAEPPRTEQPRVRQVPTYGFARGSRSQGADPVPADVLMGKEALARAIRPIDFQP